MCEVEQLKGSGREAELRDRCASLSTENSWMARELDDLHSKQAEEMEQVKRRETEKNGLLEKEVERWSSECGVVKDEASALRYQLSSSSMELQQLKEVYS